MKNIYYVKSLFRTSLVALCLLTMGVGNAWAGTKRIYAEYSAVSSWWGNDGRTAIPYIYAWGGGHDAKKYTMKATGTSNLAYCDIDDYHTDFLFFRSKSQTGSWDNQTVDISIGSNNRWSILDSQDGSGHKYTGSAQRWTPSPAIDGLLDPKNPHNQMFTDGTYSTILEAHKTYEFKILETSTLYGLNDLIATSSISNQTLNTSGYQVRLCTAGAGTYTFTYNSSTHTLSIAYPATLHPSLDYCYVIDYSWSPSANLHLWNGTSTKVAEWNGGSTIAGSIWPGAAVSNKTTIGGQSYFYIAPGEFNYFMLSKNGDNNDRSGEIQPSDGYGKRRYWKNASDGWIWDTFTVRIQLENDDATYAGTEYQDIAFNSGVLSDITCPTKTHYDFGGYYTEDGGTGTQVIDESGHWIASVADYTDASKHWIHAGTSTTLYAKWTEHEYDLTINISPAGAGTVSPSPTKVKYVTPTALLTAQASNPAYIFKEWQYSTNVGPYGGTGNDNTVQITAAQNGTLTAVFEPRYRLVGSLTDDGDPAGGMPGWTDPDADAKAFTVNSISPSVNMTKTCTLNPNSWYKFEIHDKKANKNYGHGDGTFVISGSQSFDAQDRNVLFQTKGRGEYTFTISAITESGGLCYPTVSVSGPTSHLVTIKWADVDIDNNWNKTSRETGGTVAAVATENETENDITNGQYVAAGGSITYTATPETGYTFGGWYNGGDWNTWFSNTNPITSSSISGPQDYEAKFVETSTSVTLANDGHGKVQVGGADAASTTCGVTTTRSIAAVANSGYSFNNWTTSASPDFGVANTISASTTLTGHGAGTAGTLTANFTANNYTITLNNKHGGTTSASVTYDATSLTSITHATFSGWTLLGYWNTDGNKVIEANGNIVANVLNYTDASHKWNYANNVTLYAHWSRTIALDKKEGSSNGSVTVNFDESTTADLSAPSRSGYSVEGYYADNECTHKVMEPNGTLVNYTGYVESGKWVHQTASTLYTKWTANGYTVTLENMGADEGHKGTENVSVTFDASTNLTASISKPEKEHYDFAGYWTSSDEGETLTTQLINSDGSWIAGVSGYTGASKEWIYANNITLYAKWTETAYTITFVVSPDGAGTTSPVSSTVGKLVTASDDITATPAAGYKFKEWQFSKTDENYDVYVSDGETYHSTDATIRIKAQHNGTLTAVFEPRYALVGSEYGTSNTKGMPGWEDYTKTFTVNSSSPVNLTKSCSLEAGTTYKFQIHDLADGHNYGAGSDGQYLLLDNASADFTNQDKDVKFTTVVGGEYIFKITAVNGSGRPTVTILRPHQLHMGHVHAEIDNTSATTSGDTGGTLTASSSGNSLSNNDGFAYNANITYTASPITGYTATWYSNSGYSSAMDPQPSNSWTNSGVTSDEDIYVRFIETSTSVTLSNDGHGKVQIGGADATSTTCGVTTTRSLTAVPNDGYMFSSWTKTSGDDITISSTSTNPTTLTGRGSGLSEGQEVTANYTYRWALKAESAGWGESQFIIGNISTVSGDVVGYVEISLAANTDYEFTMKDLLTNDIYKNNSVAVQHMTYTNHTDWGFGTDKTYNCGITTAGRGTYRFTWNITDKTMTVTYPNSYVVNLGVKSITAEGTEGSLGTVVATDASSNTYTNGQYIASGETVTVTATAPSTYTFVGWWNSSAYTGEHFATANPTSWTVGGDVNAYAKFTEDTNTFSTTSGNNWSTTANWSAGHVPTLDEVAIINAPVTVDITNAKAKRVLLMQNSSNTGRIEIPAGKELIVKETVRKTTDGSSYGATAANDIYIGSNASNGLGALVMGSHDGTNKATVDFYTTSYGESDNNTSVAQYVGTPFNDETNILYNWHNSWIYGIKYTNNTIGWDRVNEGQGMDPFRGYCVFSADAWNNAEGHSYWQQGSLVASENHTCSSLNYQSGNHENPNNENLLANSWMAPIYIKAMETSDFVKTEATIYIFNSTSAKGYVSLENNYTAYTVNTAAEVIPAMQSFSVFTNASGGSSVTLDYNKIVYTPAVDGTASPTANKAPRRAGYTENEADKMRLFVSAESGYGDMVYLWEQEGRSEGFENGWDGHKLFGESVAPQLYAITPDGYMAVNCVPDWEGTVLGFRAGTEDNTYTFSFEYDGEQLWYLNDLKEQYSAPISPDNTYMFTATDNDEARFIISRTPIQYVPTGTERSDISNQTSAVRKLIIDEHVYIIRGGRMYDATGVPVK